MSALDNIQTAHIYKTTNNILCMYLISVYHFLAADWKDGRRHVRPADTHTHQGIANPVCIHIGIH